MAEAAQEALAGEPALLCKEIVRISGGGDSVTFGQLMKDDKVEQTFEALMGTLKAARKAGLISFEGELLLQGQHDDVSISLTSRGGETAAGDAASADAAPAEPAAEETASAMDAPATEAPKEEEPVSPSTAERARSASTGSQLGQAAKKEDAPWAVDTSYIDWRTANPNNLKVRSGSEVASVIQSQTMSDMAMKAEKSEDGKWKQVDVGYIAHRTAEPERLPGGQSRSSLTGEGVAAIAASSIKDTDGKWKQVDTTTYINARTGECDRLEGAKGRSSISVAGDASSATVKKEGDGKWKVDTSYVKFRSAQCDLLKNEDGTEARAGTSYASPSEKKFSLADLQLPTGERPADIDPAQKEQYLSEDDFKATFGIALAEFNKMPKWKQQNMKKAKGLF